MRRLLLLLFLLVTLIGHAETVTVVPAQSYEVRRQDALVRAQAKDPAAEKQLQKLIEERPDDPAVLMAFGQFGLARGLQLKDGKKRQQIMKEARVYFERAQNAGATEPFVATLLSKINPDGTENRTTFSPHAEVDAKIKAAERAFEKRDFAKAITLYEQALKLDPTHYMATVYLGDTYFAMKQYAHAITWFNKAAALDPNREIAFRYCGDALVQSGKGEQAMNQYLSAMLAEPYNPYPNRSLQGYCQANRIKLAFPAVGIPTAKVVPDDQGNPAITLPEHFSTLDMAYAGARAKWQREHSASFEKPAAYRETLAEEAVALREMLKFWKEMMESGRMAEDKSLALTREVQAGLKQLQEIEAAGLLEAHILLARANPDIAAGYPAYRDANREKLHAYLIRYYLHVN